MIRRLLKPINSITSAAIIIGMAGLFSRVLGVFRDRLLATTFGAGSALDAYYAAFRIPDLMFNLLVLGALSAGFIPVFSAVLKKSKKSSWLLVDSVLTVILLSLGVLSVLFFLFAPLIMPILTPGFDPITLTRTVVMTRIMLFSPILLGLSAVFGGVLQSYKRFLIYSLAPILYNVGIIIGIYLFVDKWGEIGLAYGVILGSALHLLLQFCTVFSVGWRFQFTPFWKDKHLKEIIRLMGPRTLTLGITQINFFIITAFASALAAGSLSIFNLAQNLAYVPVGLFGVSFAVASFPVLSEYANAGKTNDLRATMNKTLLQIVFFLIPTVVVFLLLDEQIVRLILGAGEFDWESTLLTAKTLQFFVPGILAQTLLPLYTRAFYAQKNTMTPLYAALIGMVATLILGFAFSKPFGLIGLTLAYGIAAIFQATILIVIVYMNKSRDNDSHVFIETGKFLFAALIMLTVMQLMKMYLGPTVNLLTVRGVLIHFLIPALTGGVTYLGSLRILKSDMYFYFEQRLHRKLTRSIKPVLPVIGAAEEDDVLET